MNLKQAKDKIDKAWRLIDRIANTLLILLEIIVAITVLHTFFK